MRYDITLKNYRCFAISEPARFTLETGAVTAFVGPNNAGKSAALRFFYEFRNILGTLADPTNLGTAAGHQLGLSGGAIGVDDQDSVFNNRNSQDIEVLVELSGPGLEPIDGLPAVRSLTFHLERDSKSLKADLATDDGVIAGPISGQSATTVQVGGNHVANWSVMRQALSSLSNSIYLGASRNSIDLESSRGYYDISIGKSFISAWTSWKSGYVKASQARALEIQREISSILELQELDIHPSIDMNKLMLSYSGNTYSLDEVGSGVAQLILVLMHTAISPREWILIDEPEASLHPAMQTRLVDILKSRAAAGVLIATHNWGLARSEGGYIYTVTQRSPGHSRIERLEESLSLPAFLGEMTFSAYRDVGYRHLLLVEGRTGAEPVRRWIETGGLGETVLVWSIGGSDFINGNNSRELAEATRLAGDGIAVSVLIDSEVASATEPVARGRKRFRAHCKGLGIECHILKRRAIESYFPAAAVASVFGPNVRALGPYDKPGAGWEKNRNWQIAERMTLEDLNGTDLGEFLANLQTKYNPAP